MNKELVKELKERFPDCEILENEPMSKHTSFRIGGPAELYIAPKADQIADIVKLCRQFGVPFLVLGNGSNVLVGDLGISGVVIEVGRQMSEISINGTCITAEAGASLGAVSMAAANHGLTGMEFASGIPGCIGGAVVMNAGAYGGEMKQIITKVFCLTKEGERIEVPSEKMEFGYRHSIVPSKEYIVLGVELQLQEGNMDEIKAQMKLLNAQRTEKQPLNFPSAGSTFKRPEGYFAGKLIMDAGLAGYTVGGAQVSAKHCGFVVNVKDATAKDVTTLMNDVSSKVEAQFGVKLEPEVKLVGKFS